MISHSPLNNTLLVILLAFEFDLSPKDFDPLLEFIWGNLFSLRGFIHLFSKEFILRQPCCVWHFAFLWKLAKDHLQLLLSILQCHLCWNVLLSLTLWCKPLIFFLLLVSPKNLSVTEMLCRGYLRVKKAGCGHSPRSLEDSRHWCLRRSIWIILDHLEHLFLWTWWLREKCVLVRIGNLLRKLSRGD